MTNQAPLMKLVEIVNDHLAQGKTEGEVIQLLMLSGLDEARAKQLVSTVKSSRKNHFGEIFRFVLIALIALSAISLSIIALMGEPAFVGYAKNFSLAFLLFFIVFGIMSGVKGKSSVYIRLVNAALWLASSFMLTIALFLHPGWDSVWFGTGGGWRGQIMSLAGNALYNLGSTGVAFIFLALSILILFLFWAEVHRLKIRDYEAI